AVTFSGPERLTAMVFPVRRFVFDTVDAPVIRVVMDPFVAWRILLYSLFTGKLTLILNPQKLEGRVKGAAGANCHLGPRARTGAAVTTPPNRPSSAPSATITPSRLMVITPPLHGPPCVTAAGHYSPARQAGQRW